MMTVHEVSRRTGVSVRALHYYDRIGLLPPAGITEAGYRLYDEENLRRLQSILLYRELEFPLAEIKALLDRPDVDRGTALAQQLCLLEQRREHLDRLIAFTRKLQMQGGDFMDFQAFDKSKLNAYTQEAKKTWGNTAAWAEFEQKTAQNSPEDTENAAAGLMGIFTRLGSCRTEDPAAPAVQSLIQELQDFITANYYTCTRPILASLGQMYSAGGEMTDNIDRAGGSGTAEFAAKAIEIFTAE